MAKQTTNQMVREFEAVLNVRGRQIGCGCCVGPEDDRCICHFHQDIRIGRPIRKCSLHLKAEAA